jgi:hypothetical protein
MTLDNTELQDRVAALEAEVAVLQNTLRLVCSNMMGVYRRLGVDPAPIIAIQVAPDPPEAVIRAAQPARGRIMEF